MTRKSGAFRLALAGTVLAFARPAGAQQPELRPLDVEEALGIAALAYRTPIDLSPDGEWVAYTLQDTARHVWLTNVRKGETRRATTGAGSSWGPVWSPDGRHLVFYGDPDGTPHVWIMDAATGDVRQLTNLVPRSPIGFSVARWSEGGSKVLLKVRPEASAGDTAAAPVPVSGAAAAPEGVTAVVFDATSSPPAPSDTGGKPAVDRAAAAIALPELADVVLVDVASASVQRLARNVRAIGYWLSPDARHAAYTVVTGVRANTQDVLHDVVLVSVEDGTSRVLATDVPLDYGITVSWSPDGNSIAIATTDSQAGAQGEVFLASVREPTALRRISNGEHPSIADPYRAPLWDARGEFLYFASSDGLWRASVRTGSIEHVVTIEGHTVMEIVAPGNSIGRLFSPDGGRSLYLATVDDSTRQSGFWKVDLRDRTARPILEEEKYYGRYFLYSADVSADGRTVIYAAESPTTAEDLWVTDGSFRAPRRATRFNPELDSIAFGPSRLISWQKADSTRLHGALLLPAGYQPGERYPLIVRPYSGSMLSRNVFRFGGNGAGVDNMHILTTRGYAVLLPDVPQRVGTPMTDIAHAVLPALDRVIELGVADPDRLGVTGHSYGGYSTLALIVQSTRFKAAVSSAGPADLISHYGALRRGGVAGSVGWSETGQGKLGGHPWENRDRYIDNSPIFYLHRVETPLLLVHGGNDASVRPAQSEAVFVGLRRLGKPVAYVRYDGEAHWQGTWGRDNVLDYWARTIDWFDTYLKPGPRMAPMPH